MTRFWRALLPVLVLTISVGAAGAQDWARTMLDKSMRHREYVPITNGSRTINTLVVYPEAKEKAPVIVLVHEIFGVSDWFKLQADELAAKGYIVVAPDLTSGVGPEAGGTDALFATTGQDAVVKAVMGLPPAQVLSDLDAVAEYGKKLPSANGKLFVAGFCWGGGKAFSLATHRSDLSAAFVFYGTPPLAEDMSRINAPIYGFYGGNDNRIGATVPQTVTDMKAAGKFYEPITYTDAGHGFMRAGQAPDAKPGDKKAFDEGFARLLRELRANTTTRKMAMIPRSRKLIANKIAPTIDCAQMHSAM